MQHLTDLPKGCLLSTSVCDCISCLSTHEIPVSLSFLILWFFKTSLSFLTIFSVNSVNSCSCLNLRSLAERGNSSLMCYTFFAEVQHLFLFWFSLYKVVIFFSCEKFSTFFIFASAGRTSDIYYGKSTTVSLHGSWSKMLAGSLSSKNDSWYLKANNH